MLPKGVSLGTFQYKMGDFSGQTKIQLAEKVGWISCIFLIGLDKDYPKADLET